MAIKDIVKSFVDETVFLIEEFIEYEESDSLYHNDIKIVRELLKPLSSLSLKEVRSIDQLFKADNVYVLNDYNIDNLRFQRLKELWRTHTKDIAREEIK